MNNDWIEFKEDGFAARRVKPRVMLSTERVFRINRAAHDLLGQPTAVRFLFDVGQKRIGIRRGDLAEDNSFPVRKETGSTTQVVRGALFCNRFGIKPEHTIEFQSVRVDEQGTLILDLTNARRSTK